ncbi:MAG: AAA family ATPase [Pseudomonadota bacterium]|nr:AAA family ATPase [Pseudomonadota bacterium]
MQGPLSRIDDKRIRGIAASVLLVEMDPHDQQSMAALERLVHGVASRMPVIVITAALAAETVRGLLRMQVADWVPKSSTVNDLIQACERALLPENAAKRGTDAAFYSFMPAGGGVGNTTLAIQTAFLLARKWQQYQSTCIIDMDFQSGAIADYLDLEPNLQIEEIVSSPERLDEQMLEVMLSRHKSGIAALATRNSLREYDSACGPLVGQMLDMASAKFDQVVIDLPRVWLPWTEAVMRGSDKVFIVTEMTVPGLRQARRLIDAVKSRCGDEVRASVLVNRYRKSLLGGVNSLRQKDAEAMLGPRLGGFIAEDYRLVREAIDRGVPLSDIRKGNAVEKDLSAALFTEPVEA